ncbi:hypothetical protein [Escherichia coli]|uniref:hypothetical protein n=1 Tax=Escherichia coli TaxID=562 RepID=UPI001596951E|nr:hypothetical protein [Escherichia coli]
MNSLTTHYRRSQLIALPVPGGKAKVEYCYAVNVPGGVEKLTHEQFNNTLPSLATDCASCTGWKSEGGVLLCSKCTR